MRRSLLSAALAIALFGAHRAEAFDQSTRSPFFVQGTLASYGFWGWANPPGLASYWHPDLEFGVHFNGRHDGVEVGVRQGFFLGRKFYDVGETALRGGYDIALPFRNGRFELTIAPFGTVGVNYLFDNQVHAGVHFSVGIEGKLFFFHGLYLLVRPIELAVGQYVDDITTKNVMFNFNLGIGLGVAF